MKSIATLRITIPMSRLRMKLTISSNVMPTYRLWIIILVKKGRWPNTPSMTIAKIRSEKVSMAKSLLS